MVTTVLCKENIWSMRMCENNKRFPIIAKFHFQVFQKRWKSARTCLLSNDSVAYQKYQFYLKDCSTWCYWTNSWVKKFDNCQWKQIMYTSTQWKWCHASVLLVSKWSLDNDWQEMLLTTFHHHPLMETHLFAIVAVFSSDSKQT